MLSDRPYMREDYQRERTSFLVWLLSALIAGFVMQSVARLVLHTDAITQLGGLSTAAIKQGYLWTLVTYPLVHPHVLHVLVAGLGIFFLGRELLPLLGERRMSWLTLAAVAIGGIVWFAANFHRPAVMMGATTIFLCYLAVFACLFPNREMSFLVFFVLPVTLKPKYIAATVVLMDLCGFLFFELPGGRFDSIPFSAHLGAMLTGWAYYRFFHETRWLIVRRNTEIELPRWMKRTATVPPAEKAETAPVYRVNVTPSREDIRAEVDRILDKINSHGFGALTPEEKRVLDDAKDVISRR